MAFRTVGPPVALGLALLALPACESNPVSPPPAFATLEPFILFSSEFPRPEHVVPSPGSEGGVDGFQPIGPPLPPGRFVFADFTIGAGGTVRATMEWTHATNRMALFIMSGTACSERDFVEFLATGASAVCRSLGSDLDPTTRPADVSFHVMRPIGARAFVLNQGPTGEAGTLVITLAPGV